MRQSQLFARTSKNAPHDADSINAKYLTQARFVDQEMAGVYTWLPLGLRTLRKVEQIVREEMDALGAQEIFMPSLQPKEYWETTNRWEGVDVLFKLESQTGKEYALGCTHEEVVTPLAQKLVESYKELPFATYQINTKFRDELRAKSGVLRGREFRMKDMYSFHATQESLTAFYEKTLEAYVKAYARCGLKVKVVQASGGIFTQNISHEFQALTDAGEDMLIACENCEFGQNSEVATYKAGDTCPKCNGSLAQMKGVEVGNIFDLGTKYTDAFKFDFTNENGEKQRVLMGCYGIGTSRLVGAIVETHHDEKGIVWPVSVAPFHVHLVSLRSKDEAVQSRINSVAKEMYDGLQAEGVEVLWDDREGVSPGEKFADADLIGLPLRLVVSEKTLKEDSIEWKPRNESEARLVEIEDVVEEVQEMMK
ncbi:His/Gly/Thr/Pro-type tRNA ligase C-terminal domain-containing protein [Patescibacteria group bacterium]|jgi:prolyl-tRNA synthetase|nr:His/Gly/Thr/Pro-type tRNA ligase C-terminal domain-containing protein [Patescibacteria group bacterium]